MSLSRALESHQYYGSLEQTGRRVHVLMTSTSFDSFSDNVPDALSCGGGESMAAIFFLFLVEKKLPKKPEPSFRSIEGLDALGGAAE